MILMNYYNDYTSYDEREFIIDDMLPDRYYPNAFCAGISDVSIYAGVAAIVLTATGFAASAATN